MSKSSHFTLLKPLLLYVVLVSILLICIPDFSIASPPLPTEFYGAIYTRNNPASSGTITLRYDNNVSCGPSFSIQNTGYWGLLTCAHDDPETGSEEGASNGDVVRIFFNGEPTTVLGGDNVTASGELKFLNISHPIPVCGDALCDMFWETAVSCPTDCNATAGNTTNQTTNQTNQTGGGDTNNTGNETGGDGNESDSSGSGGSTGGGGGGGGGASGGGGGGAIADLLSPLIGTVLEGALPTCDEEWVCRDWGACGIDGLQTRICEDANACGTTETKPPTLRECLYIPSCFNGVLDGNEIGVDCGGVCPACASCTNGVQDCHTFENGTVLCESGLDCGGPCHPCDSCFNGVRDWTETGVDCGGAYCSACTVRPLLEFPRFTCEKSINPFSNAGVWFILLVLVLLSVRTYFYLREIDRLHDDHQMDDYLRAKAYFAERRKLVIFVLLAIIILLLSYLFYYEFLLCSLDFGYLWWFVLLLLLFPFVVFRVWRFMEYRDRVKLAKLGALEREHILQMERLLDIENSKIIALESDIKVLIEEVARDPSLRSLLEEFSELKTIYKDVIRLYYAYQSSKSPYGIEADLCNQVYALETNEQFKKLAEEYPAFWKLFDYLKLLYNYYEQKQKIYEQIQQERERLQQKLAGAESPSVAEVGGSSDDGDDTKEGEGSSSQE